MRRFILTGTPGSGKTSVIMELEKLGHAVIHEAATDVISQEQAKGIEKPWEEPDFVDQITYKKSDRWMPLEICNFTTGRLFAPILLVNIYPIGKTSNLSLHLYFLMKLIVASKTAFIRTGYSFLKI